MTSRPLALARRAGLLTGLVAAVLVSACAAERDTATAPPFGAGSTSVAADVPPPTTAPPIRSIAMVGDSITNGSEVELREQLAMLGLEIKAIDAADGRRILEDGASTSGVDAVTALASADAPDLWVIALGTNDVGVLDGAENYAPVIDQLLAAVPAGAPVVWVDVYLESVPDESAEFNETLRSTIAARGQATVVDWASLAEEDGVLRDGIHPSGFGIEQFSQLITAAVGQWTG